MQNRKNLHDYGLILILLGVLNLFMFGFTIVASHVDGSIAAAFAQETDETVIIISKVILGVIGAIMLLLVFADVLIGVKALKVSANPTADKGYIIVAKIFFVMSIIATVSNIVSLFDANAPIVDTILSLINSALDAVIYSLFIKAAQAVRQDVLNTAN